ncbi:MAG: NTP transferase domain-containing protein, partial [Kiritimatiellae bacterium]|nr:NTP transferase domain-containing protein [Kiritimatiellia bacterium]
MKPYLFILAGGRGERLWPLSTAQHAKPFLTLFEGKSLIELTCTRLQGLTDPDRLFIVTTADLRANVQQALPDFPDAQLLCEPEARNTAAAMAWICGYVRQRDPEGVVAVLPADHLITPDSAFREALQTACAVARREAHIVRLGIHPTRPATEYGYIACGEAITTPAGVVRKGIGFTEKPAVATAQTYLNAGNFLWNAGIFVWQAAALEAEFRRSAPAFLPL